MGALPRYENPDHFYLIGEWADIEAHMQIGKLVAGMKPEFLKLIQPGQIRSDLRGNRIEHPATSS